MKKIFEFVHGVVKSPSDKRDFIFTFPSATLIPDKISYLDKMPPVRNQGAEGSCTGHAACYLKEYMEQIDYLRLIPMSPRFAYEESKKISGLKSGSTMKATAQALISKGICEGQFWPYVANVPGIPQEGAYENAARYKVCAQYARITNEADLKVSLAKVGPILAGVIVYKNWNRNVNGHIPNPTFWEKLFGKLGGHAITICGYDNKTQEYEFINSWGAEWGYHGFGFISFKHMKEIIQDAYALIDINDSQNFEIKTAESLTLADGRKLWI